ncbi:tRNA-splicing endonuclease subunit Sen15 [Melipona quadrifasciata]|uniref:tRNA-splicing endonuclease subunit Sen15 n=1 Tax=Melipona quadrifasciata TaxID=166423 RepID=A0A0M9A6Y6_9HYME|nr:tRNA-splicing endonuclease subunit Sen15 [Melipona quadrifasciata]
MCDVYHPSYYNIGKLGCTDPIKISTTFYVYIELCEAKRYWEVNYKYNENLDLLYLEVKRNKNSQTEVYVPWPTSSNISLDMIEKMQRDLDVEQITLVFKLEDSTSIIYKVSKGLVKPASPGKTKLMKEKEEKKLNLEKEIRKNTSYLYELAKSLNTEDANKDDSNINHDNKMINE